MKAETQFSCKEIHIFKRGKFSQLNRLNCVIEPPFNHNHNQMFKFNRKAYIRTNLYQQHLPIQSQSHQ